MRRPVRLLAVIGPLLLAPGLSGCGQGGSALPMSAADVAALVETDWNDLAYDAMRVSEVRCEHGLADRVEDSVACVLSMLDGSEMTLEVSVTDDGGELEPSWDVVGEPVG